MKKTTLIVLTLILTLQAAALPAVAYSDSCLVAQQKVYSQPFADTAGVWCNAYVQTCYETGLIEGFSKIEFRPFQSLTCAQILAISARIYNLLNGGDGKFPVAQSGEAWYAPYYTYLRGQRFIFDFPFNDPELSGYASEACTRWNFVSLLKKVLPDTAYEPVNSITTIPDVSDDPMLLKFYNAGILNGTDKYGSFRGDSHLTRGQAAAILARVVDPAQRMKFSLNTFDLCKDVLGVEPETVMLRIDGTEVTAEQFAYPLVSCLTEGYAGTLPFDLKGSEKNAISRCQNTLAYYVLAQKQCVILTEAQETKAKADAVAAAGSYGVTENGWLWQKRGECLEAQLRSYYISTFGTYETAHSTEPAKLWEDLAEIVNHMTVEKTDTYLELNLASIRELALNSPFINQKLQ